MPTLKGWHIIAIHTAMVLGLVAWALGRSLFLIPVAVFWGYLGLMVVAELVVVVIVAKTQALDSVSRKR